MTRAKPAPRITACGCKNRLSERRHTPALRHRSPVRHSMRTICTDSRAVMLGPKIYGRDAPPQRMASPFGPSYLQRD